ncbi:MAG: hypothetical protein AUJ72_01550 [Candidatus Omnitrophica bacterium CG1_02_46_14]|nr:MAG: hypothetical protein AUJ72_01550 [Candidatus Omnitrophica bacterium CG1_02_46_14]
MTLSQTAEILKKTPLYDRHVALNGKIVNFAGWLMPIYYSGIIAEHRWTRSACTVFDVSHLGEFHIKGSGAFKFLQHRLTNDLNKLKNHGIQYHLLCDEKGFTIDDLLVYQNALDDYTIIVNAANIERDWASMTQYAPNTVTLKDQSDEVACVAVQGPKSETVIQNLFHLNLKDLGYYQFKEETVNGCPIWISRSGYTGEDGFEMFTDNSLILEIWDKLVNEGTKEGVLPAGLGARNTLRLEAGNALYGNDIDATTTPLEAGLRWAVSFDKGDFVGRSYLIKQKENGIQKCLIGFKMLEKPIAREHYSIMKSGKKIGIVTSGSYGPSAGYNIGLGFVQNGNEKSGTRIEIEIHGKLVPAEVVKRPFVELKHKK